MKNKYYLAFFIALFLTIMVGASPAQARELMAIHVEGGKETMILAVPKPEPYKVFVVPNPERLVVDVPQIPGRQSVSVPASYHGVLVKAARFGQFDSKTSRFVFDMGQNIRVAHVRAENGKQPRIVIDIVADDGKQPPPLSETNPTEHILGRLALGKRQPEDAGQASGMLGHRASVHDTRHEDASDILAAYGLVSDDSQKIDMPPATAIAPPPPSKPNPVSATAGKVSPEKQNVQKARAENTKFAIPKTEKPLIVIDPGHGGVDPGTTGADGRHEKDVVFGYAEALKARLLKTGRYRVMLTRGGDRFIMLRQRVEIARKAHASLFVSLHADSAPEESARGLSVYTVSEQASDKEAAALAARENKADVLAGMDLSDEREDVANILISLAQRETKNSSAAFADIVVVQMEDKIHLVPNAHRFAGFAVLKAPDIPSVLVEIGFLSNRAEETQLESAAYREKVTSGLARGIDAYFQYKKQMGQS